MIRKRYYHYPSPIAIDRFNTRVLQALSTKLSRDYLGFFGSLAKTYTRGEQKKKLDSTVGMIKKSIVLLENMISMNRVSRNDVKNLVEYVEEINRSRDDFLLQAEQNKSFEAKMQKVSDVTGISPQDLSMTKEIITKGAAQVRRRTKEGVLPFIKRAMPGTLALGGELGRGGAVAALGPFAPIAGMLGTLAKGAWGIGSGIRERRQLGQEERLSRQLAPMAESLQTPAFRRMAARRAEHPFAASFAGLSRREPVPRRRSKEEMVLPLTYFFDKKAHKTKWTKELLDRFKRIEKGISKRGDSSLFGGLFGKLAGGITPLIGKLALLAAGVVAVTASFVKIKVLWDKFFDFQKARKGLVEAKKRQEAIAGLGPGTWGQEALKRKDPVAAIEQWKKEGKIDPLTAKKIKERIILERIIPKKTIELKKDVTDVEAMAERFRRGTSKRDELLEAMPTTIRDPFRLEDRKEKDTSMLGVQKAVEQVNDTLSRQQGSGVRGAALGDPFGVGDPLLANWSSGQITVESD